MKKMYRIGVPDEGEDTFVIAASMEEAITFYKETGIYEKELFITELPDDYVLTLIDEGADDETTRTVDEWLRDADLGIFATNWD
jgi:hypothetical protein